MEKKKEADRAVEKTNGIEFFGKRLYVELSKKPFR